jgi:O-antigen/teichoic acid export membrane protein
VGTHREVVRGAVWNLIGYAIAGIGALLLPIVLIKNVGRGAYGVYSYVTLLLTQAYLLLGGLGEALAYFLANHRQEAIYWIRGALGAALLMGALGLGLWQWRGPEILTALLNLDGFWQKTLSAVRGLTSLALVGYQVAVLLGWVPLGLGRRRSLILLPLGQLVAQVLLPMGASLLYPNDILFLFEVSLYGGIGLGLYMWGAISVLLREPLWPIFSWRAWKALWKHGLWQNLAQWNGLFLTFFERTIIGRFVSLSYMGLYSAGQYFSSKALQAFYKATESLLSAFGGEGSLWRRHLRLGQTIWFTAFISVPTLIILYGVGGMVFPYVAKPWHLLEMRLWGGLMLSTQLLFLVAPLAPFFIGQGRFRILYLYSLVLGVCQVGGTLWLVPQGYYYWGPVVGVVGGIVFLTVVVFRKGGVKVLWWEWVLYPLLRVAVGWGTALSPLIFWGEGASGWSLALSIVGAGIFLVGEWQSPLWPRKRDFLLQVWEGAWGFVGSKMVRVGQFFTAGNRFRRGPAEEGGLSSGGDCA